MYEIFEHTADLGLRIRSADLNGLFGEAGLALFSAIVVNLDVVRPVQEVAIRLEADRRDDLLHDWLAELLFIFDTRRLVLGEFQVEVSETRLSATARGEPLDTDRHQCDADIKAITYHALKVEPQDGGWLAEVIVDV